LNRNLRRIDHAISFITEDNPKQFTILYNHMSSLEALSAAYMGQAQGMRGHNFLVVSGDFHFSTSSLDIHLVGVTVYNGSGAAELSMA